MNVVIESTMKRRGATGTPSRLFAQLSDSNGSSDDHSSLPQHLRQSPDASKSKTTPRRSLATLRWWIFLALVAVTVILGIISLSSSPPKHGFLSWNQLAHDEDRPLWFTKFSYSPSLLTPVKPSSIDVWKQEWNSSLIHIIHTRFMQEQANLTTLGEARLHLFRVFCLPTMVQQSSQNFVWIVKTDPNLPASLLQALWHELSPYPNIYLVGSLNNFRINHHFPGAWRDGAEPLDLSRSRVYTGDRRRLELAMALEGALPVLETRLDADDGLHVNFVHALQEMALRTFETQTHLRWTYWCARRHMEWHWIDLAVTDPRKVTDYAFGVLYGTRHEDFCITPGITVGFPVGIRESDVPIYAHDKIVITIRDELTPDEGCGLEKPVQCLQFIENFVFCALRSRTPTSAGMLNVQALDSEIVAPNTWLNYAYWEKIHESFGLKRERMRQMNQFLVENLVEIARENLMGQCTTGHSCKVSQSRQCAIHQYFVAMSGTHVALCAVRRKKPRQLCIKYSPPERMHHDQTILTGA